MKIDDLQVGEYYKLTKPTETRIVKLLEKPEKLNYQYKAKAFVVLMRKSDLIPVSVYYLDKEDHKHYFDPNDEFYEVSPKDVRYTLKTMFTHGV